jgi:drug/metabolite transporter (DMT)-like permease
MKSEALKIVLVYILLCFIWGSTWLAIRFGLESLTPLFSAGIRFMLASFFIYILMRVRKISIQKDSVAIRLYILMGFLSFVIPFGLVYWAEQYVPSGMASVLFAVYPFFVVIFSYIRIPADKIGMYKILGTIIGFLGIVVIFSDSFTGNLTGYILGMFACVLSGVIQAWIAVSIKKFGNHLNPLSMNLYPMIIGGVFLLVIGYFSEDLSNIRFDENAIFSVLYLAFFGSVITFTSFYWLMQRIDVVILSLLTFITPIVALILGYFVFNETLSFKLFVGSVMVLAGVFGANFGNMLKSRGKKLIKS